MFINYKVYGHPVKAGPFDIGMIQHEVHDIRSLEGVTDVEVESCTMYVKYKTSGRYLYTGPFDEFTIDQELRDISSCVGVTEVEAVYKKPNEDSVLSI